MDPRLSLSPQALSLGRV